MKKHLLEMAVEIMQTRVKEDTFPIEPVQTKN